MSVDPGTELQLADWRRQVSDLYSEVRRLAVGDVSAALTVWREERERLYRDHPIGSRKIEPIRKPRPNSIRSTTKRPRSISLKLPQTANRRGGKRPIISSPGL